MTLILPCQLLVRLTITDYPMSVRAANDTSLSIFGSVTFQAALGSLSVEVNVLMTDHVQEIIRGEGFMLHYDFGWHHGEGVRF